MTVTSIPQSKPEFSRRIQEATRGAHHRAQASGFMLDLLGGLLSRERYVALVGQLLPVYCALEEGGRRMADEPAARPFIDPVLEREAALRADLRALVGGDAIAVEPTSATSDYCARIRELSDPMSGSWWPAGYIAHHYVRYLGDLSGGQVIRKVVEGAFGTEAASFYAFDAIPDLGAFKAQYRTMLNDAPWGEEEREGMIAEILRAYELNDALVASLDRQ